MCSYVADEFINVIIVAEACPGVVVSAAMEDFQVLQVSITSLQYMHTHIYIHTYIHVYVTERKAYSLSRSLFLSQGACLCVAPDRVPSSWLEE